MSEVIATIWVDKRISEYADFLTTERGTELGYRTEAPKLQKLVDRLMLYWRGTAYSAAMPAMYVQSQERHLEGFANDEVNDTTLIALTEHLLGSFAQLVPELVNEPGLAKKLIQALIVRSADFRDARAKAKVGFEVEASWQQYLGNPVFQQYVWSTQRQCYQAIYNAYEDFLIECVNLVATKPVVRTVEPEFQAALERLEVYGDCWDNSAVQTVALHRHSLAHMGGRETPRMTKAGVKPMNHPEVSQVFPENIKEAINVLADATLKVIDAASSLPQFN